MNIKERTFPNRPEDNLGLPPRSVELVKHNPIWRRLYTQEKSLIVDAIGNFLVEIHHVGSTAILGLKAKPIIDILASVDDLSVCNLFAPRLEKLGYENIGTKHVAGHHVFGKGKNRSYLLHFVVCNGDAQERILAFKRILTSNPKIVGEYEKLKIELARKYKTDRDGYARAKTNFIDRCLKE